MKQAFDGKERLCFFPSYEGAQVFMQSKNGDLSIPPAVLLEAHVAGRPEFYRNSAIKVDPSTADCPFLTIPRPLYPFSALVLVRSFLLPPFLPDPRSFH